MNGRRLRVQNGIVAFGVFGDRRIDRIDLSTM